ncbi:hypothetical protein JYU09_01690, partial [bacterium AH-315-O15]|nr:hypothetical protein [bacterium AH-315-O15]
DTLSQDAQVRLVGVGETDLLRLRGTGSSSNSRSTRFGMRLIVEVLNLNDARPTPFAKIVEGHVGILEQAEIDSRDPQTFGVSSHP